MRAETDTCARDRTTKQRRSDDEKEAATSDLLNLNVDGQEVSQKMGSLAFGQSKFSRESIAEFQIVTNQYDITRVRSVGMEMQAITKARSNIESGSAFG